MRCQVVDALVAHVVLYMPVVAQRQLLMVQMTSCLSPYSALSLVRQRTHALRQSMELFKGRRIQRYAWFNSGYKFMRQTTEADFAGSLHLAPVLFVPLVRPMMRCIVAGMDQEYSYVGGAWWQLLRFSSCSSSQVVDYSFVLQRQLSMVPPCRKNHRSGLRSWRNSWWWCRRRPLLSLLCRRRSTSWWKCRRSCLSLSGSSRVQMGTFGGNFLGLRGPTGGGWAPLTPSGPPHLGTPPGQGGIQILAAAMVADVVVVDVAVNMQHKLPQFWCFIQFINRVVVIPVATQTGMHSVVVQKTVEILQLQFLDLVVVPVRATTSFGTDSAENCGIFAGAAPVVLWTSL